MILSPGIRNFSRGRIDDDSKWEDDDSRPQGVGMDLKIKLSRKWPEIFYRSFNFSLI